MDLHKRSEREATVRTCGIFSQASHPIFPLGIAARQMSNIHLLLLSPVVGNCSFYIHVFLLFFFPFYICSCVCVLACVRSARLWLAEAPERVRQQRDQTERDCWCGGWRSSERNVETKEKRGNDAKTRHGNTRKRRGNVKKKQNDESVQ